MGSTVLMTIEVGFLIFSLMVAVGLFVIFFSIIRTIRADHARAQRRQFEIANGCTCIMFSKSPRVTVHRQSCPLFVRGRYY